MMMDETIFAVEERETYLQQRRIEIGQRLQTARRRRRISQVDVAHYLGCSRVTVTRVENGTTDFTVGELELLARLLDVSILHLLGVELTVTMQGQAQQFVLPP